MPNLGILRFSDISECSRCWVHNIKKLHDSGSIIGNGCLTTVFNDELVHTAWTQRCTDSISNSFTGIDVTDKLRLSLGCVGPLPEKDNLRLLQRMDEGTRE